MLNSLYLDGAKLRSYNSKMLLVMDIQELKIEIREIRKAFIKKASSELQKRGFSLEWENPYEIALEKKGAGFVLLSCVEGESFLSTTRDFILRFDVSSEKDITRLIDHICG